MLSTAIHGDRYADLRALSGRGVAVSFGDDPNYAHSDVSDIGTGVEDPRRNRSVFRESSALSKRADLTITPIKQLAEYYLAAGATNVAVI